MKILSYGTTINLNSTFQIFNIQTNCSPVWAIIYVIVLLISTMATEKLDIFAVLRKTSKITSSHSRHFLALQLLFTVPSSFLIIVCSSLYHTITHLNPPQANYLLQFNPYNSIDIKPIILLLLYGFTLLTLLLCSTATVSYSTYHGFFGRPVKFLYAFRSLSNSLLRLFVTFLCAQIMMGLVFVGIGLIVFGVIKGIVSLGFVVEYKSAFHVVGWPVLGFGLVCFYVNWVLAPAIVVVESSWGLEPLRRSAFLVKGMRGVVFCLLLLFGWMISSQVYAFGNWESMHSYEDSFRGNVYFVVQTVCGCITFMVFTLYSFAANTLLYVNCKALQGELAGEIAEETAPKYVSLPCDEEKAPPSCSGTLLVCVYARLIIINWLSQVVVLLSIFLLCSIFSRWFFSHILMQPLLCGACHIIRYLSIYVLLLLTVHIFYLQSMVASSSGVSAQQTMQ